MSAHIRHCTPGSSSSWKLRIERVSRSLGSGSRVGSGVGANVGISVGSAEGPSVGSPVGTKVGTGVGGLVYSTIVVDVDTDDDRLIEVQEFFAYVKAKPVNLPTAGDNNAEQEPTLPSCRDQSRDRRWQRGHRSRCIHAR